MNRLQLRNYSAIITVGVYLSMMSLVLAETETDYMAILI